MQIYVSNNFHTKRQVTISPPSSPPTIFSQPIKSIPPFNSPQIRQPRSCQTDNTSFLVLILICQFRFLHAKRGYKHTHTHTYKAQQIVNFSGTYSIDIDSRPVTNAWYVNTIMRTDLVTAVTWVNRWPTRETITLKPDTSRLNPFSRLDSMKNSRRALLERYSKVCVYRLGV